jgi:hypothetical protein
MRSIVGSLILAWGVSACGDDSGTTPDAGPGGRDGGRDAGRIGSDAGDDDGGGGMDAGGSDSGAPGDAGTVGTIMFAETCPGSADCGGDLEGTWIYEGTCVTTAEAEAILTEACPEATFEGGAGTISGSISFDGTMATRRITSSFTAMGFIPESCTMMFGCLLVGPAIEVMASVDDANCVDAAGGCDCEITDNDMIDETVPYTVTGNTYEDTTSTRRWDYCVSGSDLVIREVMSGMGDPGIEPGIQVLDLEM